MNFRKGNIGLIILVLAAVGLLVVGGYLFWQKRCGVWPFEDFNVRCELGQRIVSNKVFPKTLTWEECLKAPGAVVQESYPAKCVTPDGKSVIQQIIEEKNKEETPTNSNAKILFPLNDPNAQYFIWRNRLYYKSLTQPEDSTSALISADTTFDLYQFRTQTKNFIDPGRKYLTVRGKFVTEMVQVECIQAPCPPMEETVIHIDSVSLK